MNSSKNGSTESLTKQYPKLKLFKTHGVRFISLNGTDNAYGNCPFCGSKDHFYANVNSQLWDCKKCGKKGNMYSFLKYIAHDSCTNISKKQLKNLASNRGLPWRALKYWLIGWNGIQYTVPVRGFDGRYEDIRIYSPGKKTMSTGAIQGTGLFGAMKLAKNKRKAEPVYVCEGEWDAMSLHWLLRKIGKPGVVVGVPGAGVFKESWVPYFKDRDICLLYDHDEAGEDGELRAFQMLAPVARSIRFIRFPESAPTGFDVRDFVKLEAFQKKKPKRTYKTLLKMLTNRPRKKTNIVAKKSGVSYDTMATKKISPEKVFEEYAKWFKLEDYECIKVLFGSFFANKIEGDPMWVFLVGPPGSLKSELLMSLSESEDTYATASLTPHTLISGAVGRNGEDPSLLPKLDGKVLIIKDFTTILSMHYVARDEIFGTLRDAYDGKTEKNFGTGIVREYKVRFGVMAGVTPKIEGFGVMHQSLGERFIKYFMPVGNAENETDKILKALDNVSHEVHMRRELALTAKRVCDNHDVYVPEVPKDIKMGIIYCAQLVARMRGVVERNQYSDVVICKPSAEVATRLAKQFTKLAMGIAVFMQNKELTYDELHIIKKIARNTAPDRVEETVRQLWFGTPDPDDSMTTFELVQATRLPTTTIQRVLDDLVLLRIVQKCGERHKSEWQLTKLIRELIIKSDIYGKRRVQCKMIIKSTKKVGTTS